MTRSRFTRLFATILGAAYIALTLLFAVLFLYATFQGLPAAAAEGGSVSNPVAAQAETLQRVQGGMVQDTQVRARFQCAGEHDGVDAVVATDSLVGAAVLFGFLRGSLTKDELLAWAAEYAPGSLDDLARLADVVIAKCNGGRPA